MNTEDYTQIWGYSFLEEPIRLVLTAFLLLTFVSCDKTGNKNMNNLKKVSIDMSVNEVIEIMGKPIDTVDYFKKPVIEAYYYEAPFLNSGGIYIGFDDKGKVNFIKSDKGEIKTKKKP